MKTVIIASLAVIFLASIFLIPNANALPVSYNQSSVNFNLATEPRNASSFDVITLPDKYAGYSQTHSYTTATGNGWDGFVWADQFTSVPQGTISALQMNATTTGGGNIRVKFYDDSSNNPNNLLGESNSVAVQLGIQSIPLTSTITVPANGKIWAAFEVTSAATAFQYTTTGIVTEKNAHVYGTGPNPFVPAGSAAFDPWKSFVVKSSSIGSTTRQQTPIAWYNAINGSTTLTKKLGEGMPTLKTSCKLNSGLTPAIVSNGSNIYYACNSIVHQLNTTTGIDSYYFTSVNATNVNHHYLFQTAAFPAMVVSTSGIAGNPEKLSTKTANTTLVLTDSANFVTNQKIQGQATTTSGLRYNSNATTFQTVSANQCEIHYVPTNLNKTLDALACDQSLPAMAIKYWQGFLIQKVSDYSVNRTQQFLDSIDANTYKKLLSLPCPILTGGTSCMDTILTDSSGTNYLVVITSNKIYFGNAQTALTFLLNHNYAIQSYDVMTVNTSSLYEIQNPILQSMTLYGFDLNVTINKAGLFTLPSGYSIRTTTISPSIRLIDPQWTNDATDIPVISSTSSLFPIFLTASNAPAFSAIKVTSASQIINGQESVWAVAQLDSTRSVEFDLPPGVCANIYIADISVSPSVWDFEGIICATGVNQKTIAFTNTVPFTFYTQKYGVTSNFVPSNNGLTTTFRSSASPVTYNVLIQNSTGAIAVNSTFSLLANQTLDTRSFNVSSVTKPASLTVSVGGNPIYTSYLGSPLSLASVSSFFHQYLSYQGFDFLSFIPIIFASMFTRNTVGIGVALTVVLIATLSWLSVVVIPEMDIYIMIVVAAIAMIGYRSLYG